MSETITSIEGAIQATAILSSSRFSWFGKPSVALPARIRQLMPEQTVRSYLLYNLQNQLYADFYCMGVATRAGDAVQSQQEVVRSRFTESLSAAHSSSVCLDEGWQVGAVESRWVTVEKNRLRLRVRLSDCVVSDGGAVIPQSRVSLRYPNESNYVFPGYFFLKGNNALSDSSSQAVLRWYWNVTSAGAAKLIEHAAGKLNHDSIPFMLKVVNDPTQFNRCDSGVIYTRKEDFQQVAEIFQRVYVQLEAYLRQQTPAFAKSLAPGLGLAEDPLSGESFGQNRTRLLADGMILAYEQGKRSHNDRLRVVVERFEADKISLEFSYLNPGSTDGYEFQPECGKRNFATPLRTSSVNQKYDAENYLRTSVAICDRLLQEAVWFNGQCNWVGNLMPAIGQHDLGITASYEALGPEFYAGTSGIAYVLARIYSLTGNPAFRRTALGAIGQALARAETTPLGFSIGLYDGLMGIAFAATQIGTLLAEPELLKCASRLIQRCEQEVPDERAYDIISGNAGVITALLALRDIHREERLLPFAMRLGDELISWAEHSDNGLSWQSTDFAKHHNLTGFSHGAAGAGHALLKLYQVTGDTKYRVAAEGAYHYENKWFDDTVGNWPDFRWQLGRGKLKRPIPYALAWCHGAPGIALSRLHAYIITNDDEYLAQANVALNTTRVDVQAKLNYRVRNFSLCHGIAGNADILLSGGLIGHLEPDALEIPFLVGQAGIALYAERGNVWPCGSSGKESLGLMLGLAGIAHFYLRLYDSSIPSILVL